jgi:glycosyltransferase involved in cell wall biosynthesis
MFSKLGIEYFHGLTILMPRVTLCLPIYNAERFLEEAVRSVRNQTLDDFEVIAVLDGCTDRSEEVLRGCVDERFRIVKKDVNEGIVAASNLVLRESRSVYNGRMDADDVMEPQRLRRQAEFLDSHPEVDVVGTWYDEIDDTGKRVKRPYPLPATHEGLRSAFRRYTAIGGPTVMFRTERIRALGGYDTRYFIAEDLSLWLRCMAHGYQLANIPEVLHHYRRHTTQITTEKLDALLRLTTQAYAEYGPAIWGDSAPVMEFGLPLHRRALRKLRRMLRGEW